MRFRAQPYQYVSRETYCAQPYQLRASAAPSHQRESRFAAPLLGFLLLASALAAFTFAGCSGPPSPRGWAPAQPVEVGAKNLILVPFKGKLTALPPDSTAAVWQFPPRDKASYAVSEQAAAAINNKIDALGLEGTAVKELETRVTDLHVSGPSKDLLNTAVDASAATDGEKKDIKALVDLTVKTESDALKSLKAIYGNLGLSADGDTTYLASFRGVVFALDTDTGATRWIRNANSEIVGGVAVAGDVIYFGTRERDLLAVDARTAETKWVYRADGEVWSTPTIEGDGIYFTSLDGTVYALDASSGDELWTFDDARSGIAGQVTVADGALYVGAFDNKLYALDAADGAMRWSFESDNWFWAKPLVSDGIVYAASLDGKVYAVRAEDGTSAWDEPFDTGSPIRSSPVLVGGGLVVAARNARLHKLNLKTGAATDGSPVLVGEESTVEADLAVGEGGRVYVVPRGRILYVFEATTALRSIGGFPLPN
jgi:outer membrane protein assembly factor BamB